MSELGERTINQALADARGVAFLNDTDNTAAGIYKDANLLSLAAFVLGEIEDEFAKYGLKPKEKTDSSNFSYTANTTSISIPGSITDFRHPIEIWEADTGQANWKKVDRVDRLPAPPQQAPDFLGEWEWSENTIKVNACSRARALLVRYRRDLTYPPDGTGESGQDYYWALVSGVAAYAAAGTAREDINPQRLDGLYRKRMMDAILVASRDKQVLGTRQKSRNDYAPFGSGVVVG